MSLTLGLAQAHIPGLKKKTATEWAGPCPDCGGDDRFLVWTGPKDAWYCRGCEASGDAVSFLRRFCGRSCPDAHRELGVRCESLHCPAAERCAARVGDGPRPPRPVRPLVPPAPAPAAAPFVPASAAAPAELWRARAAKLVAHAHEQLLANAEQLAWLAGRGLPRAAVECYRLGWLGADAYRPRAAWGLPESLRADGKPKKLWLPAGLVIPFLDAEGMPTRLRIRRRDVEPGQPRYYWVPGSGDDVPVLEAAGQGPKAYVVVESDLDAFLVHWAAGDLVGAIPLGSCSTRPKEAAAAALQAAKALLVALDADEAGARATAWWTQHYPRARRWPVPAGKDPGEYAQGGGDVRAWVLAGLPPVFQPAVAAVANAVREAAAEAPAPEGPPPVLRAVSKGGIPYVVAATRDELRELLAESPGAAAFTWQEIARLKGASPEEAHAVLLARQAFPESELLERRALP